MILSDQAILNICPGIPLLSPKGKRGSSGRFCFSSSCFFSRSLRFHIASDRFECCAAHTPHIVSPVPEIRFLVERLEMLGKAVADTPGTGRFQIVDQCGDIECGMDLHQQMHVIRFPSKLKQAAAPIQKDLSKGPMQVIEQFRSERLAPIFCHKNNVHLKRVDGMGA